MKIAFYSRGLSLEGRIAVDAALAALVSRGNQVAHVPAARPGKWLAEFCPDALHTFGWSAITEAAPSAQATATPLVHSILRRHQLHELAKRTEVSPAAAARDALINDGAHLVTSTSAESAALARFGLSPGRITVVPSGVDTATFRPEGAVAIRTKAPRIVYLAGVERSGGGDDLIRALRRLPHVDVVFAARTRQRPFAASDLLRLSRLAEKTDVADRVSFLDNLDDADLAAVMRSADVCAALPHHDLHDSSLLRAMACGVPVVATACGAAFEWIEHGISGVLVPPCRPDPVARALYGLLADSTGRRLLGAAAADRMRVRHDWDRIAHDIETVYAEAIATSTIGSGASSLPNQTMEPGLRVMPV